MNLANVHIVLVGTTHPGNIGAAARAMKTMGLSRLTLVAPKTFPSAEATALASGADDLLANAQVFATLEEALAGHEVAYATTARPRRLEWPLKCPRETAADIDPLTEAGSVAVVFGREQSGLSNEELELCQRAVRIPTAPDYASLNLGQAVQVIAYELGYRVHAAAVEAEQQRAAPRPKEQLADADTVARLGEHMERAMVAVGYLDPERPKLIRRRLRRLGARAGLRQSEVQILRGFLTRVEERAHGQNPSARSDHGTGEVDD